LASAGQAVYRKRSPIPSSPTFGSCQDLGVADIDELKIQKTMRPMAEDIIAITDVVCAELLDAEYVELARQTVAKLARKRPSPLLSGKSMSWAGAVVYALGQVNFVFDRTQQPHVTPTT
jgi:hypothetical protein